MEKREKERKKLRKTDRTEGADLMELSRSAINGHSPNPARSKSCIRFKTLMLAYKAKNGPAPPYLMAMVKSRAVPRALRASSTARREPPSLRTHGRQASRLFSVLAPRWWNELPLGVRTAESLAVFKRRLKTRLLVMHLSEGALVEVYQHWPPVQAVSELVTYAGSVGPGFLLVHNNARPHVARVCRQFLENKGIDTIDWPTGSPDLNPIEHLWDIMFRSIRRHQVALQTVQELSDALVQIWEKIPQDTIRRLIRSMWRPYKLLRTILSCCNGMYECWAWVARPLQMAVHEDDGAINTCGVQVYGSFLEFIASQKRGMDSLNHAVGNYPTVINEVVDCLTSYTPVVIEPSSPSSFNYSPTRPAIPEDKRKTSVQTLLCRGTQTEDPSLCNALKYEHWPGVAR
ncbi:hypothetical protein NFI96_028651 [Prochilodus magdalenae]|nr:hypothetical protein NFI96_028651 [Prochilodus magdalenae]